MPKKTCASRPAVLSLAGGLSPLGLIGCTRIQDSREVQSVLPSGRNLGAFYEFCSPDPLSGILTPSNYETGYPAPWSLHNAHWFCHRGMPCWIRHGRKQGKPRARVGACAWHCQAEARRCTQDHLYLHHGAGTICQPRCKRCRTRQAMVNGMP